MKWNKSKRELANEMMSKCRSRNKVLLAIKVVYITYSQCVSPAHKVFHASMFDTLWIWQLDNELFFILTARRGFCSYIEVRQQITCIEFSLVCASGNLLEFHNVYELDLHFYYGGLLHMHEYSIGEFWSLPVEVVGHMFYFISCLVRWKILILSRDMYNTLLLYYEGQTCYLFFFLDS